MRKSIGTALKVGFVVIVATLLLGIDYRIAKERLINVYQVNNPTTKAILLEMFK